MNTQIIAHTFAKYQTPTQPMLDLRIKASQVLRNPQQVNRLVSTISGIATHIPQTQKHLTHQLISRIQPQPPLLELINNIQEATQLNHNKQSYNDAFNLIPAPEQLTEHLPKDNHFAQNFVQTDLSKILHNYASMLSASFHHYSALDPTKQHEFQALATNSIQERNRALLTIPNSAIATMHMHHWKPQTDDPYAILTERNQVHSQLLSQNTLDNPHSINHNKRSFTTDLTLATALDRYDHIIEKPYAYHPILWQAAKFWVEVTENLPHQP